MFDAFTEPREALRRWFRRGGRRIYIAGTLPIYYPGERMFSPDLIAVDGADHEVAYADVAKALVQIEFNRKNDNEDD